MPLCKVILVRGREPISKKPFVILGFNVMNLEPHAGNVDSVAMRRKTSVSIENIVADIPRAFDHFGRIGGGLLKVVLAVVGLVDLFEQSLIIIDAGAPELARHNRV